MTKLMLLIILGLNSSLIMAKADLSQIDISEIKPQEIVVVTHIDSSLETMHHKDVVNIYMGKFSATSSGIQARALDLESNDVVKARFYKQLTGLSLARVNAYWSRIKFTGRVRAPATANNIEQIKKRLVEIENAIAYVPATEVTQNMKVVYRFDNK
jgi:hypothetical protein